MLYFLSRLSESVPPLNLFRYITFRAALAAFTAFVICLVLGPAVIALLKRSMLRERAREDAPERHKAKAGTPSMGGLFLIGSTTVSCALWLRPDRPYAWIGVFALLWFGAVGFLDDYLKIIKKVKGGLPGRWKLAGQALGALVIYALAGELTQGQVFETATNMPLIKVPLDLGWLYVPFVVLVLIGASNAVNLTDGLDGLAIGCASVTTLGLGILAYVVGNAKFADYLWVMPVPDAGELAVLCAALLGAGLGFLWFNAHPAEVFLGDTGSLALGGTLGATAFLIRQELLLPLLGGVFVVEALSVMIQVASFKLRGKRVFKMAPIHHHFELMGWMESKVIIRFWIASLIFALLSLSTLKLR